MQHRLRYLLDYLTTLNELNDKYGNEFLWESLTKTVKAIEKELGI